MANLLCCCDRSVLFFAERSTGCAGANSFGRAAPGELLRQGDGRAGQAPSPASFAPLHRVSTLSSSLGAPQIQH
jgi:hypothetical protein